MGDEESIAVLPEEGPDLFAIGARQRESIEILASGPVKGTFLVVGRYVGEAWFDLEEEH